MQQNIAFFRCIGGASGDMILGALVDLGVSIDKIVDPLSKIVPDEFTIEYSASVRNGMTGTQLVVRQSTKGEIRRNFQDFVSLILDSDLSNQTKKKSLEIFETLKTAESKVHGIPSDEVHLHELGQVDTLVDVVGSVLALEELGIDRVFCSGFPAGNGVIKIAHGIVSVPAPATETIFVEFNAPIHAVPNNSHPTGEMVTPSGAAILCTLSEFGHPNINLVNTRVGLGSRNPDSYPNALSLWIGTQFEIQTVKELIILETNIDDMSPELFGYVQEELFKLGARDVWFTPIQMKKNRPGTMLSVLVTNELESKATELIFRETTTLGIRIREISRIEADREIVEVKTEFGSVRVKVKKIGNEIINASPEYEDCKEIAEINGLSLQEVFLIVQRQFSEK